MTGTSQQDAILRRRAPPIVPATGWTAPLTTLAALAMSFLAVLTLVAGVAADRLAAEWRADLAGLATVRVSASQAELARRVDQAMQVLGTTPGIAAARPLTDDEHAALLAPWLGAGLDIAKLPAPRLIEVDLGEPAPDMEALQARLDREAPGALFDSHQSWREPLARAADSLELLAWAATGLIVVAAAGMVALAARATLAANLDVVRLVRLIGGEDAFIARAFVARLALRGFAGGLIGTALAILALQALPRLPVEALADLALMPEVTGFALLLVGVPVASGLIAWATALNSVRGALRRMV